MAAQRSFATLGLAAVAAGGTYFVSTKLFSNPAENAKQSMMEDRVCIKINFCSEWSYMPKAKSIVWALQEEFEHVENKIYFQVQPQQKEIR